MCVVSMVMDHYEPRIQPLDWTGLGGGTWTNTPGMREQIEELKKLIAEFKEAVEAAKRIDVLTKQPDCEDPEKVKLLDRVAELERRLDQLENSKRRRNPRFK